MLACKIHWFISWWSVKALLEKSVHNMIASFILAHRMYKWVYNCSVNEHMSILYSPGGLRLLHREALVPFQGHSSASRRWAIWGALRCLGSEPSLSPLVVLYRNSGYPRAEWRRVRGSLICNQALHPRSAASHLMLKTNVRGRSCYYCPHLRGGHPPL